MTTFCKVVISQDRINAAEAFLTRLPFEMRTQVVDKALRAAAAPVVKWAKELAPDSVKTGSRTLWSAKTAAARAGNKQLGETITAARRSYGAIDAIYIGPSWPAGNIINVIGHPHKQMRWGRATGRQIAANKFLQNAAEITRSDQGAAFTNKVQSETERLIRKGATP